MEPGALRSLAGLFLKLGCTAFGGPAAHIAMMEAEVVRRRGWMDAETFLDLVGTCNLLPGPNSTELAIHIGLSRAGWRGLLVAGTCFIGPAALITLALAWAYVHFGWLPQVQGMLLGLKPVILAIVAQALWKLGRPALKNATLGVLGCGVLGLSLFGYQEGLLILGAGGCALALGKLRSRQGLSALVVGMAPTLVTTTAAAAPFSLGGLFWVFLKVGSVLFGSGYVLLAFLRTDLVHRLHWLTEAQLLDAVAVGQVTPGPVFTTATFIGFLLGSWQGAALATLGIFLPSFLLVGLSGFFLPKIRKSPALSAFMDGVNVAAVALMVSVLWDMGRTLRPMSWSLGLAVLSLMLLLKFRIQATWLLLGGGMAGLLLQVLHR